MNSFSVATLKHLKHPNIIDLYGYSDDSLGNTCLIYPLMDNGNLKARLKYEENEEKYLTSNQRVSILLGISKGIRHIHRLKKDDKLLIHRDIKPENILLDGDLQPKVNSFHKYYILYLSFIQNIL